MSLSFGHDELEPNHIHNVKPLVALPYNQLMVNNFQFVFSSGINYNVWRKPAVGRSYVPRRDIITNGLICFMRVGTIGYKLIDEFDLMPYKVSSGMIDGMNHFLFNRQKLFFISDIQPNYKNMFKMSIRTKRTSQDLSRIDNESLLEVITLHTQLMKRMNDVMLQTL